MWLAEPDKPPAIPTDFVNNSFDRVRLDDVLKLSGSLEGLDVLDLGGGALLATGGVLEETNSYTLVDFSSDECDKVRRLYPAGLIHCQDVITFLYANRYRYDVVTCFGLTEYLPDYDLLTVFQLCPAPVFCFGTSAARGYLQYSGRISIPCKEDIDLIAEYCGWRKIRQIPMPSHVWARFEK